MNMDKQQHLSLFNNYVRGLEELKEDLKKIITNDKERHIQADALHSAHSNRYWLAHGHYNNGKLWEVGSCRDIINEYSQLLDELSNLKNNLLKKTSSQCVQCGKTGLTSPYVYKKGNCGYLKVFCSQSCFNNWSEELDRYVCDWCKQKKSGKYWYPTFKGKRIVAMGYNPKFCSEECLNYSAEDKDRKLKEENKSRKNCFICSKLLTKDEVSACSPCSKKQEEIWKNLEKNQQDINKDLTDFNQGLNDYVDQQENNANGNNGSNSNTNDIERERERETNQLQAQQSQLLSEITQLASNPTANQNELEAKRKQLQDLQTKEKELTQSLPLPTQITLLKKEINQLTNKPTKTKAEEALLTNKKQELEELLKKQQGVNINNSQSKDKTALYFGGGVIVMLAFLLVLVLTKDRKKNKEIWKKVKK